MVQQTNLIDPGLRKSRDWLTAKSLAIATVATIVAIGGTAMLAKARSISQEHLATEQVATLKAARDKLVAMSKLVAQNNPSTALASELAEAVATLKSHEETIQAIEGGIIGGTTGFAEFMRGFARQTPDGLWLTGFTIGATDGDMEIRGRMTNPSSLTEYIRRLKTEPVFAGRSFSALAIDKSADTKEVDALQSGSNASKDSPQNFTSFILKPDSADDIAAAALSKSLNAVKLASVQSAGPRSATPTGRDVVDPVLTPATENLGRAAMEELAGINKEQARANALKKMSDLMPPQGKS